MEWAVWITFRRGIAGRGGSVRGVGSSDSLSESTRSGEWGGGGLGRMLMAVLQLAMAVFVRACNFWCAGKVASSGDASA